MITADFTIWTRLPLILGTYKNQLIQPPLGSTYGLTLSTCTYQVDLF